MQGQRSADASTYAQLGSALGGAAGLVAGLLAAQSATGALAGGGAGAIVGSVLGATLGWFGLFWKWPRREALQSSFDLATIREVLVRHMTDAWIEGDRAPLRAVEDQASSIGIYLDPELEVRALHDEGGSSVIDLDESSRRGVYDATAGLFLLCGGPGAGKTVWLWRLARELLDDEPDGGSRIPIVVELNEWELDQEDVIALVREDLHRAVGLSPRVVHRLIEADVLTLMFDGFDELAPIQRRSFVVALDRYIEKQRALGRRPAVVLTTRWSPGRDEAGDDAVLPQQITWAVTVCPLDDRQRMPQGQRYRVLRDAVAANPALQVLTRTPLWLTIASRALEGVSSVPAWARSEDRQVLTHELYEAYIAKTYSRRRGGHRLLHGISFLAYGLKTNGESVLRRANLRSHWLPDPKMARTARWIAAGTVSLPVLVPVLFYVWGNAETGWAFSEEGSVVFLLACSVGLAWGLPSQAYRSMQPHPVRAEAPDIGWSVSRCWSMLPIAARVSAVRSCRVGATIGAGMTLIALFSSGLSQKELLEVAAFGSLGGTVITWVAFTLDFALDEARKVLPTIELEGRRTALRRSMAATAADVVIRVSLGALVGALLAGAVTLLAEHVDVPYPNMDWAVVWGAVYGLVLSSWCFTPTFVEVGGTLAAARVHGALPLRLGRLLAIAQTAGLMYPAGGGYRFMHRTLQEHLAERGEWPEVEVPIGLRLARAERAAAAGRYAAAVAEIDESLDANPNPAQWQMLKAFALEADGAWRAGVEALDAAVVAAGSRTEKKMMLTNKALLLFTHEQWEEAHSNSKAAIKVERSRAKLARTICGVLDLRAGDTRSARRNLRAALSAYGQVLRGSDRMLNAVAFTGLGDAHRGKQEMEEALELMSDDESELALELIEVVVQAGVPGAVAVARALRAIGGGGEKVDQQRQSSSSGA